LGEHTLFIFILEDWGTKYFRNVGMKQKTTRRNNREDHTRERAHTHTHTVECFQETRGYTWIRERSLAVTSLTEAGLNQNFDNRGPLHRRSAHTRTTFVNFPKP
jgi:hypothetical protein